MPPTSTRPVSVICRSRKPFRHGPPGEQAREAVAIVTPAEGQIPERRLLEHARYRFREQVSGNTEGVRLRPEPGPCGARRLLHDVAESVRTTLSARNLGGLDEERPLLPRSTQGRRLRRLRTGGGPVPGRSVLGRAVLSGLPRGRWMSSRVP